MNVNVMIAGDAFRFGIFGVHCFNGQWTGGELSDAVKAAFDEERSAGYVEPPSWAMRQSDIRGASSVELSREFLAEVLTWRGRTDLISWLERWDSI